MSQQKKQKVNITNRQLLQRLRRLPITTQCSIPEILAYIGLLLVNKGKRLSLPQALRIIHNSKLHTRIIKSLHIPTLNILESLIWLSICKRDLLKQFFKHQEYEIWDDEVAAPLFDVMYDILRKYQI